MAELVLECDLGNTRCNWRLRGERGIAAQGVAGVDDQFAGIPVTLPVRRVLIASVAEPAILESLQKRLSALGVTPELARSQPRAAGVTNAYGDQFAKLGVDRWLAAVAAYQRVQGAVLVLDAGSALTADLVAADGMHLGGYIVPGERLMQSSLLRDTGQVRFPADTPSAGLEFGRTTAQAVGAGVWAAQVGAANMAIDQAGRRIPGGFAILVTGGVGERLLDYLQHPAQLVPELVLDGLAWVCPE